LNLPETFAPFADGGFLTPSGKCEFYSESLEREGLDPLPTFTPPRESPESAPELAARYPLQLISPPANSFLNTTFSHLSSFLRSEREPFVQLSAADAERRGIKDGDAVRVWNDRGVCRLRARITDRVKPGVAVALSIWWNKLSPGRANINQTVSQALTDIGAGATFFDNLVEVEKIDRKA
jgi:anaerobic selenocysteine-containing dehydrogenase